MGGGLMQLVAYGAQDIYLTGNPQITFFKVVYRRHTNFSMEAIEQTWNGTSTADGRCTATISRNGDLVHRMYLEVSGGANTDAENLVGAVTSIELEIGGQRIDKHSGKFMETYYELTEKNDSATVALLHADGNGTLFQNMSGSGGSGPGGGSITGRWWIPLIFWFNRNPGLALPLIALQYHEVKVIMDHLFKTVINGGTLTNSLWCDYIYLDTDERRRFAQVSHEYLIEQVQEQALSSSGTSHDLNFNHPVKELIWSTGTSASSSPLNWCSLIIPAAQGTTYQLKLNGHDRFAARDNRYFSRTQVWEHHTGVGGLASTAASAAANGGCSDSICVYSFSLKPEEHQPSGTCNFSRIDNAQLVVSTTLTAVTDIYAINYNVLRIMSGMGGLAYSN
jgi:hypothetical protein